MEKEEIIIQLNSKKSAIRRSAAKKIGKLKLTEYGNELYNCYLKEKQDIRTWETQSEMIKALGLLDYKEALSEIEPIVLKNMPHDSITSVAATSFVQLKRKSIHDAKPVIYLLNYGSISVISGALYSLPADRMIPSEDEIKTIIEKSRDINKHPDRIGLEFGLMDPRIYLALACADWNKNLTTDFLNHCIKTAYDINRFDKPVQNTNLIEVCENSLKGKFSKEYI